MKKGVKLLAVLVGVACAWAGGVALHPGNDSALMWPVLAVLVYGLYAFKSIRDGVMSIGEGDKERAQLEGWVRNAMQYYEGRGLQF